MDISNDNYYDCTDKQKEVKCDEQIKCEESIDIYYGDIKREIKEEEGESTKYSLEGGGFKIEHCHHEQIKNEKIDIYYEDIKETKVEEFGYDVDILRIDSLAYQTVKPETNSESKYIIDDGNPCSSGTTIDTESKLSPNNKQDKRIFKEEKTMLSDFSTEEFPVEKSMIFENSETSENVCKKSFPLDSNLSKKKSYNCEFCKKSFSYRSFLKCHQRTHTGEKPYNCKFCKKSFSQKSHLIVHQRTHSGEKPYSCEFCEMSFFQKGHLLAHQRTHTGEKPYNCELCKRPFSRKGSMIIHQRVHTKEKPYKL
ncbi:uncharacterized protein isoform X2 [Leptinotarsa decemlineata]|uniref:uncharacterized protein isoform X2 n=1 Tax=Leptinotarsa decemlineata TaxID=7539 RepID=UPI003D30B5C1